MDSLPEKDLKKIFGRAFQVKKNWSTIDRLKIRQLSKAQKTAANQYVQELTLKLSEDLVKIRAEFPNLKKIKICMPEDQPKNRNEFPFWKKIKVCADDRESRNVARLKELSLIKGLQELHLDTPLLADTFTKAIKDPEIAERFKNCTIYLKYCGPYLNEYNNKLENIRAISTRLSNARINVEYSVTLPLNKLPQTNEFWQNIPNLRVLNLNLSDCNGTSLRTLKQLKNLRSLTIKTHGRSVPLQGFPALPWITTLCISASNVSVRDYQLQILRQQTGLKKLSLEFGLLNISNVYFVNGLADLEILKLKSVKHVLNEIICFSQIKKLLNLREFHFSIYKDNMKHVNELKQMLPYKMCRLFIYNNNNTTFYNNNNNNINNTFYNNNNNNINNTFYNNNNNNAFVFFGAEQRIVDEFELDQLQQDIPIKYFQHGFSEFL